MIKINSSNLHLITPGCFILSTGVTFSGNRPIHWEEVFLIMHKEAYYINDINNLSVCRPSIFIDVPSAISLFLITPNHPEIKKPLLDIYNNWKFNNQLEDILK